MAAPPAGTYLAAFDAVIRLGTPPTALTWYGFKWTVNPQTNLLEANSFELGGFEDRIGGLRHVEYTVEGFYDAGGNPYDPIVVVGSPGLNLVDGAILGPLLLFMRVPPGTTIDATTVNSLPHWSIPRSIISSVNHVGAVEDRHLITWNGFGRGSWIYPTGNVIGAPA